MTANIALVSTTFSSVPQLYQGSRLEEEPLDLMYTANADVMDADFQLAFLDTERGCQIVARADAVIVSTTNSYLQWNNHPMGLELFLATFRKVRELAPSTPTVVIGPHVPGHYRAIAREGADVIFLGESEIEAANAAVALAAGQFDPRRFKGVVTEDSAQLPTPAVVDDLDMLPMPAWRQTVGRDYNAHNHPGSLKAGHLYEASRGCPYQCSFCNTITQRRAYRMKSPAKIQQDLRSLSQFSDKEYVYFIDESFGFNRTWVSEVFDVLEATDFTYGCQGNLSFASIEKLERMAKAGFVNIEFGYETANKGVVKNIGKNNKMQAAPAIINSACDLGLAPLLFTQVGLPGETLETLRESVSFLKTLDPRTRVSIAMTTPYFDTALWRQGVSDGLIPIDARGNDLYAFSGRTSNSLEFDGEAARAFLARFGPNNYLTADYLAELEASVFDLFSNPSTNTKVLV